MVRRSAGIAVVLLALGAAVASSAEPTTADLIGYGRLQVAVTSAADGQGSVVFACESPQKADQLLSKLRADLTWDRFLGLREVRLPGGAPAYSLEGLGVLVLARKGSSVYAVAGATPPSAEALAKRHGLAGPETHFTPERRHPMSLDFFDLRPISMYYLPLNVRDLESGWKRYDREALGRMADFWARFSFGYSTFEPYFGMDELADGAPHFFPLEYCVGQAKARNMTVMTHLGQYWAPWWLRNRFPKDIVQWDPYFISGWGPLAAMSGTHLSQAASDEAYAYSQRFMHEAISHLQTSAGDNLGCFRVVGGGHPGDELGLHHLSTEFMDYDEAGQQAFRRWLRDERKLDLRALSKRWYDDEARFKSWDEVHLPSHAEFFGGFGEGTLDLLDGWLWRPDSPNAEAEGWSRTDYRPGDEWTPTDLAPSTKQLFLFGSAQDKQLRQGSSTVAWLRREFDPSAWLAKNPGRQVYLVAQVGDPQNQPVEVWLNDSYLGPIAPKTVWCGPIAFKATALVRPGRNVLCLKVQNGLIRGPVFLTTEEPKRYPYLGRTANARWVDLRDWNARKLILGWTREARPARQQLPDIPLLFCPGSCLGFADQFLSLKRDLGIACIHFTGGGSSYMPWWSGLGYVWGAYGTSEEGGTISDPAGLSRELAWMLIDGHGHHNYYYDALDCMRIEEKTGWFSKNARLFELYGKANWQRPPVAVLRAAHSDLYFPYSALPDDWDIGRSSLQAAHYQNVYVTESELKAGLVGSYPVLWDAGTSVMDDDLLASIERYVRAGGTFVAVNVTGRHSLLEPDTWPIERLTGFKVLGERENMHVTVLPGNPLLKRLAGMTFNGNGIAVNWMGANHLAEGAVALEPKDGDGVALAKWEDGSVAVGMRQVGKGRVIILGSSFWRSMSDRAGNGISLNGTVQTTFFSDLLSSLGIPKQADIDSEDVWVRRFTTKNGLQEWVMAYNAGRAPLKGLTLSFPLAARPRRVLDLVSGKPADFAWEAGSVRVPNVGLDVNGLVAFGVDRANFLAAVEHWFAEKQRYETRPSTPPPTPAAATPPAPPATAVVMSPFRFRPADDKAKTDLAWLTEATTGAAWKDMGYGFWDELGCPAKGIGLYRRAFRAPEAWRGRRVLLTFASFDYPVFLEKATVYLNGQRVGEYAGHPWANFDVLDITPYLRPGENALGLLVEATEGRGGYLGQLAAFALENLEQARDLKTGWRLYADNRQFAPAALPLDAVGRHLETDVALPASWKDTDIFLEFEVSDRWVGIVVVNGRPIAYNQFLHPYGDIMQINLYPFARPGQTNRIELWPYSLESAPTRRLIVKSVRVGMASRGGAR